MLWFIYTNKCSRIFMLVFCMVVCYTNVLISFRWLVCLVRQYRAQYLFVQKAVTAFGSIDSAIAVRTTRPANGNYAWTRKFGMFIHFRYTKLWTIWTTPVYTASTLNCLELNNAFSSVHINAFYFPNKITYNKSIDATSQSYNPTLSCM